MSLVKGNGAPTAKTRGAIGDLYLDVDTGAKYQCISRYRDSLGHIEINWKQCDGDDCDIVIDNKPVTNTVVEAPEESAPVSENNDRNRNNYHKPYKPYNKYNNKQ